MTLLALVNLFGAGLLAGEEFAICYAVRTPLATLEPGPHILLRQALIRRLRIVVPAIFVVTFLSGIAALWPEGTGFVFLARCTGLVALFAFLVTTLTATVPINQAVLRWTPAAPPDDWQSTIRRWERLDILRTWVALFAFACFVLAMALPTLR
jgi:uncharacterized membrane protein